MKHIIPISEVCYKSRSIPQRAMYCYPLYETYRKVYNFRNIEESLSRWNSYSKDEQVCFEQAASLLDYVLESGTASDKRTAIERVSNIAVNLQNPKASKGVVTAMSKKADSAVKKEAVSVIESALDKNIEERRIIANHEMISKRFNVDSFVRENLMFSNDPSEVLYEMCSFVETYKLGLDSKFKIALEECLFAMAKNNIEVDEETVLEAVTDFFISNEMKKNDKGGQIFDIMDKVCKSSKLISNWDYIKDLQKHCKSKNAVKESMILTEADKGIINTLGNAKNLGKETINKFKSLSDKTVPDLKTVINKLFILKRDEDVINDTSNVLSLIFYLIIIAGTFAIGVLPGILGLIVTKTINMHLERKYYDKVLKKWYAHRDATATKMEKCKDPEKKKKLEEYLKELDKNIEKLEDYSDAMRGDDEKKSSEKRPENYSKKDDDDFGDLGFGFEASNMASDIEAISFGVENIKWDRNLVENTLLSYEGAQKLSTDDLNYLAEFAIRYPGMLSLDKIHEAVCIKEKSILDESTSVMSYVETGFCSSIKEKVELAKKKEDEVKYLEKDTTTKDVFKELNDLYKYTSNINHHISCFNELSMTSNLKLAADKLMNGVSKLSDKEQVASRTLDGACRLMQRSVERALTMENREAVIRGDILPSLSKIIKLAAVTGVAALIHPALAAIILIGRFAMSAKIRTKERQMVVDELSVELKMIDKYIQDADDKKDYKKERELMLVKKKLQNQYSRLSYNINVEWKDDNTHMHIDKNIKNDD